MPTIQTEIKYKAYENIFKKNLIHKHRYLKCKNRLENSINLHEVKLYLCLHELRVNVKLVNRRREVHLQLQ